MSGVDFLAPSPAQQALRNAARDFGAESLDRDLPGRDARGAVEEDWRPLWRACAQHGLLGLPVPAEYGGGGHDVRTTIQTLEALGEGCRDNGLTLAINGHLWAVCMPLLEFGSEAQKKRYLPGLCSGERIGCFALTEADTGSDAMALRTSAERSEDDYILNGDKVLVGMAPGCDFAIVFANAAPENGAWGVAAFIVEAGDSGVAFSAPDSKLGVRTTPLGGVTLRDCRIPEDRRIGPDGAGMSLFQFTMEWERAFIFSGHVGSMARQLSDCTTHARSRRTFGAALIEHQSVANRLADMRVRLETSRLLLHRAAALKDEGRSIAQEAAMTKLHISEAFAASSLDALRIFGGSGYMAGTDVERDYRDAAGGLIYSGASDIQRRIISRLLP